MQFYQRARKSQATYNGKTHKPAHEQGRYRTMRFKLPLTLTELAQDAELRVDPWGREYQVLNFTSPIPGLNGKIRTDHTLHPLNSEFDLYSFGKDGESRSPLTARASRDDVIWARDGDFVGLAEDY
jgi:general secretion pathway protein G